MSCTIISEVASYPFKLCRKKPPKKQCVSKHGISHLISIFKPTTNGSVSGSIAFFINMWEPLSLTIAASSGSSVTTSILTNDTSAITCLHAYGKQRQEKRVLHNSYPVFISHHIIGRTPTSIHRSTCGLSRPQKRLSMSPCVLVCEHCLALSSAGSLSCTAGTDHAWYLECVQHHSGTVCIEACTSWHHCPWCGLTHQTCALSTEHTPPSSR